MHRTSALLREARVDAGLTQAELARLAGTTQSVVARMESPASNPTLASVEQVLGALNRTLELAPARVLPEVDETQIVEQLRLTPELRLARHDASQRNLRTLVRSAKRVGR